VPAVAADGSVGCDVESIDPRTPGEWDRLLGADRAGLARAIAQDLNGQAAVAGPLDGAATRVWAAMESLKKIGRRHDAPLVFTGVDADGWVRLRSGADQVLTCVVLVEGASNPVSIAIVHEAD
jgi:enediyne polyketide synthase